MITKKDLKENVALLVTAIGGVGNALGIDGDLAGVAKVELAMFMMYLSASDGKVKWEEASLISELFDLSLTASTTGDFIREHNIYSTEFESKVPLSLKVLVNADNALLANSSEKAPINLPELLLAVYKVAGEFLIQSDDTESNSERADINIYMNMLSRYIAENSKRPGSSEGGFTKK